MCRFHCFTDTFVMCLFYSHDYIGEFTTCYRELSRGQSQFNVYEVSCILWIYLEVDDACFVVKNCCVARMALERMTIWQFFPKSLHVPQSLVNVGTFHFVKNGLSCQGKHFFPSGEHVFFCLPIDNGSQLIHLENPLAKRKYPWEMKGLSTINLTKCKEVQKWIITSCVSSLKNKSALINGCSLLYTYTVIAFPSFGQNITVHFRKDMSWLSFHAILCLFYLIINSTDVNSRGLNF